MSWNHARVAGPLADVRHRQGRFIGHMEALGFQLKADAVLRTLTADVLKSSEIEGEKLDEEQVRSSLRAGSAWTSAVQTGGPERRGDRGDDARARPATTNSP
jgi:Fic family protein